MGQRIPKRAVPEIFMGQRVAVFLDIQSLFYACRDAHGEDARLDYGPLLEWVVGDRVLTRAIAYLRYNRESDTHGFHQALNNKGFEVKSKPAKDHRDRNLTWTVGMCLDILRANEKIDMAIVLTHEEEFADALQHLSTAGIPVEVWGFKDQLGSGLKQNAAKFLFIPDRCVIVKENGKLRALDRAV